MEFEFDPEKIQKYFNNYQEMQKKIGPPLTKYVKKRVDQLRAASSFQEYLDIGLGKPHSLSGNFQGCYAVSLTANYRLIIVPDSIDLKPESLSSCKRVIVKGVTDYHGAKDTYLIP